MQMNEQVLTALEVLRNFAENDFERHRIDVLEKDLTAPPKVEVIDDKYQKFNGVIYHKKQKGYYVNSNSIHQAVYRYYCGEIPNGYVIHHRNLNPVDSDISNLRLMTNDDHKKLHNQISSHQHICKFCGKSFLGFTTAASICPECKKLTKHKNVKNKEKSCPVCGKNFIPEDSRRKCCSAECSKTLSILNNPNRKKPHICPECGKSFIPKTSRVIFCSISCGAKHSHKLQKANQTKSPLERICPICGKKFTLKYPSDKKKFCSHSCASKYGCQKRKQKN